MTWRASASVCWRATVLDCWGITSTADIGAIVFTLVAIELLSTQPDDKEEDFAGVYEFGSAFDEGYEMKDINRPERWRSRRI